LGTIGSLTVKGSLAGNSTHHAEIFVRGLDASTAPTGFALKSLTIDGSVNHARIFAGVDNDGVAIADTNAQIGTVSISGDWIASDLESGCVSNDSFFGDGNDALFGTNTISRIASVVIKGQVLGESGTNNVHGFLAKTVGAFKYNGITVPLNAGPGTDRFVDGKAHAVGSSLSTTNTDGFAVHVFEV
jgi:hypothetical protein